MFTKVKAVMMFVEDVPRAVEWYEQLLSTKSYFIEVDVPVIEIGEVVLWFHKSDVKVSSGTAGMITYWQVEHFDQAIAWASKNGGKVYRGPLEIEDNESICQILDPFGNLFGLCG